MNPLQASAGGNDGTPGGVPHRNECEPKRQLPGDTAAAFGGAGGGAAQSASREAGAPHHPSVVGGKWCQVGERACAHARRWWLVLEMWLRRCSGVMSRWQTHNSIRKHLATGFAAANLRARGFRVMPRI